MNRKYLLFLLVVLLVAVAVIVGLYGFMRRTGTGSVNPRPQPPPPAATLKQPPGQPPPEHKEPEPLEGAPAVAADFPSGQPLHDELLAAEADLQNSTSVHDSDQVIARLRAQLSAADAATASAAIRDYLATGRNARTGGQFTVGQGGAITQFADLRTALLDILAQVDPAEALRQAETVFNRKTSADEYAVSLRNQALLGPTGDSNRDYVARRARELLTYQPWIKSPTAGFAEAFDAAVYTDDMKSVPILAGLASPAVGDALNHPAFMALDGLVQRDTDAVLTQFEERPELLGDRPLMRAGFFARADPNDPSQVDAARQFLLSQPADSQTAQYFLTLYPNLNQVVSDNLLTQPATLTHAQVMARLHGALKVISNWEHDPAMGDYYVELTQAEQRIRDQLGGR